MRGRQPPMSGRERGMLWQMATQKESVGPHQEIQAKKRMGWATCREFNQFKRERWALARRAGGGKKRERGLPVSECDGWWWWVVCGEGGRGRDAGKS
jgi:hypothetical protein